DVMASSRRYFQKLPDSPDYSRCLVNECGKRIKCANGSTTGLIRHLLTHNIATESNDKSHKSASSKQSTLNFERRDTKSLSEILARSAAVDGTSLRAML